MRLMCFLALSLSFIFCGCAKRIEYVEVFLPQKCTIPKRERPAQTKKITTDVKNILVYTQMLELDLKKCRGEK